MKIIFFVSFSLVTSPAQHSFRCQNKREEAFQGLRAILNSFQIIMTIHQNIGIFILIAIPLAADDLLFSLTPDSPSFAIHGRRFQEFKVKNFSI